MLMSTPVNPELKVVDLRLVIITYDDYKPNPYWMHKDHVDMFVQATIQLHHNPGVNPYNGVTTARLHKMEVQELCVNGPYWWTKPGLGKTTKDGAELYEGDILTTKSVFYQPTQLQLERAFNDV